MLKRATTSAQKREVIESLLAIWESRPELRLLQLILNFYPDNDGFSYCVEDYDFVQTLERYYRSINLPVPLAAEHPRGDAVSLAYIALAAPLGILFGILLAAR